MPKSVSISRELTIKLRKEIVYKRTLLERDDTDLIRCDNCATRIIMDHYKYSQDIPQLCNICEELYG